MSDLFVYGTLLSPEIVSSLTGKNFSTLPAKLHHYKRYLVKSNNYPAILPRAGSSVKGLILKNIDTDSERLFEFYEGEEYILKNVIAIADQKEIVVNTFVWNSGTHLLEQKDWDLKMFETKSLKDYLEKIVPHTVKSFKLDLGLF